jgi:transcriptional regulator with XRE-family HTH domain
MPLIPRQFVEQKLHDMRVTPGDFARQRRIDFEVVHKVLQGDYPENPPALNALGQALGAESHAWAAALAAGLARLSSEDAAKSLKGRLWAFLIERGMSVPECAEKFKTRPRVLYLALSSGQVSGRLKKSQVLDALGLTADDFPDDSTRRSVASPALQQLIERAFTANPQLSMRSLAEDLGVAPKTISFLLDGTVPHVFDPVVVPSLAFKLKVPVGELAHVLASLWRTQSSNIGTLKYLVAKHCFTHGLTMKVFAQRSGVSEETVRNISLGRIPNAVALEAVRAQLRPPESEWDRAIRGQAARRMADSGAYRSLADSQPVKPLNELITAAADRAGVDAYTWGQALGISTRNLRSVLNDGHAPRREEIRAPLIRALHLERLTYDSACRLMAQNHRPRERYLDRVSARTGIQEHFLRLIREQGMTVISIGRAASVSRKTIEKIARYGASDLRPEIQERIRRYIGMSPETFQRQLEPVTEDLELNADDELRLVSVYRKLPADRQKKLLEIAGRLLAEKRPLTLTYAGAS